MKKQIRLLLSCALSFSLIPATLSAAPNPKLALSEEATEQVQQIYDILRPARRDETLAEVYHRAIVFIDGQGQDELANYLDKAAGVKTPEVERSGHEILLRSGKNEARIEIRPHDDRLEFRLNGQAFSEADLASAPRRWKKIETILNASARGPNKNALWWAVGLPSAEAGLSDIFGSISTAGWITIGGVAAIAAVTLYTTQKNKKESKKRKMAAAIAQCTDANASCCNVNGALVNHTNGCCQQISGLRQALGVCPTTATTATGATTITPTLSPVSGQR